tara:strand:- start:1472 stop:2617 length:1146 start_codon:yes stop_codon:yes gene_type:complete
MANNNDFIINNNTAQQVRLDIQEAFQQLASNNFGTTPPVTTDPTPVQVAYPHQWFANGDTGKLMYKDASTDNNATTNYFNLANLTGGLFVDQASTFNGDVIFQGSNQTGDPTPSGVNKITFDVDSFNGVGSLNFARGMRAVFGDTNFLEIAQFTTAANAITSEETALIISGAPSTSASLDYGIQLQTRKSAENALFPDIAYEAIIDGGQKLYFDGSTNPKLETTADGIEVTGSITATAQPACLLINPVDVSVTSSDEDTPLKFATEQTNVGCTVNTDKDRITVPFSGTYLITACISGEKTNHTNNDSNENILKILKNGSDAVDNSAFPRHPFGTSTSEPFSFFINMPLVLNANDYLEICLDDFSGATADVKFGYFSVTKLN